MTWPLPEELDEAQLEARLFQRVGLPVGVLRPLPDMAEVHRDLKRPGVTLQRLWLEYLERQPATGYRYSQFCLHYHRWRQALAPTMRQIHRAGEKVFVDFSGKRPSIIDAATGERTPVELFVGALGASSYVYVEACPSQELPAWIAAHVRMVEYFGGGRLAKTDLLVIDDWGLAPLTTAERHDFLEVLEDRTERAATLITSQLPVKAWHEVIGEPTLADAICDRLIHTAYIIELHGPSMRETRANAARQAPDAELSSASPGKPAGSRKGD